MTAKVCRRSQGSVRSLAALGLLTTISCQDAVAQGLGDAQKLRQNGIPQASARLNALLAQEVGGEAAKAPGTQSPQLSKQSADTLIRAAQAAQAAADLQLRGVVGLATDGEHAVLRKGQVLRVASDTVSQALIQAQATLEAGIREEVKRKVTPLNQQTLRASAVLALDALTPSQRDELTALATTDPKKATQRLLQLGPALAGELSITGSAKALIVNELSNQIRGVLPLANALTAGRRELFQFEKKEGWQVVVQTAGLVNEVLASRDQVVELGEYLRNQGSTAGKLQNIAAVTTNYVAQQLKLPPEQQRAVKAILSITAQFSQGRNFAEADLQAALKTAKIPGLEKVLKGPVNTLAKTREPEAIGEGLSNVQGYLALASAAGIKVDPNLNKAVGYAVTAVNLVGSLSSGNYVGAVMQMTSLFGAGDAAGGFGAGGDPGAQMRHEELLTKLGEVISLQKQTLEKLDALSKQMAESTERIMASLDRVNDTVSYLAAFSDYQTLKAPLADCREFVNSAAQPEFGMNADGVFPSYEKRRSHFAQRGGIGDAAANAPFTSCASFVRNMSKLVPQGDSLGLPVQLWRSDIVLQQRAAGSSGVTWAYDRTHFAPMLTYTTQLLGLANNPANEQTNFRYKPNCTNRAIAAFAAAPASLHQVHYARLACGTEDIAKNANRLAVMSDGAGESQLGPGPLFTVPVHARLIAELSYYSLLLQGYHPLVRPKPDNAAYLELRTEKELAAGGFDINAQRSGVLRLRGMLDIVNVAIAQQTMMSGAYISAQVVKALLDDKFGDESHVDAATISAREAQIAQAIALKSDGCPLWKLYPAVPLEAALCMLGTQSQLAANVMLHLVMADALASGVRLTEYKRLFDDNTATEGDVNSALPGLAKYLQRSDESGGSWALKLKSKYLDKTVVLPLPTTEALRTGRVAYSSSVTALLESRTALLEEVTQAEKGTAGAASVWASSKVLPKLPRYRLAFTD